jgi:RNA polymerase sigma-70 factor, ECF subfamily
MSPEEAFDLWAGKIYAYLRKIGFKQDDAQDGVQEVFKKALLSRSIQWNKAGPYLYKIAWHWAIDCWKKPVFSTLNEELASNSFGYEDDFMAHLTARERSIIILHYQDGFSFEEISKICKEPAGTIKSIVHRAKKKIKERENI